MQLDHFSVFDDRWIEHLLLGNVPLLRDMLIPPFIKDGQHRSKGFTFPSFRPSVHRFFFLPFSYCTYLKVMCPTSNVSRRLDGPNFNGLIAFLRFRGASDGRRSLKLRFLSQQSEFAADTCGALRFRTHANVTE